jgi:hypothetical protein
MTMWWKSSLGKLKTKKAILNLPDAEELPF